MLVGGGRWRALLQIATITIFTVGGCWSTLAEVHYYRDSLLVRFGPPNRYTTEVPVQSAMQGTYFRVTTDDRARIASVEKLVNGQVTVKTVFQYSADTPLPDRAQVFTQGVLTGSIRYQRDTAGEVMRCDNSDVNGILTGYWTATFSSDHSDSASFTAAGTTKRTWTDYYAGDGVTVREISNTAGSSRSVDSEYDHNTGLTKIEKISENGNLIYLIRSTYDSNDNLVRNDHYDVNGTWYAADFYQDGLEQKKLYAAVSGRTKIDIRFTYDSKRWIATGQQYVSDKLVCTFNYEHLSDGTIKRTLALGPDGSLWAEYPDTLVQAVEKSGRIGGRPTVGTIYKIGDWW